MKEDSARIEIFTWKIEKLAKFSAVSKRHGTMAV